MDWVSVEMSSNFARSKCLFHRLSRILLFVVVFFTTPNHNSCQEEEVDAENLHRFLTPPEWQSYFGNSGKVPLFDVVRLPHRTRRKRSASGEHLRLQALGEDFDFTLWPTPGLLDENFVMLNRNESGTDILPEDLSEEQHCFYQGLVRHRSQDTNRSQEDPVAVGLCGGMRGLIASKNHYYVINPLPHRFRKRSADPEDELLPHVMVRKSHPRNDCHNRHVPGKRRRKRGSLFPSVYYSGSSTVKHTKPPPGARLYIETAVYVDKDLYNLMEVNFPKDTKREIIRVVLAMVNAVQLLYQDPSLGRPVDYVLKRLEILQSDPSSLERSPDIDNFLTSFCRWQREMNPASDSDPNHWDHALILTGLDLYVRSKNGKISKQVVGLAPVAGMCTRMSSCTVNEGRHFESVYVVAHEIGHNLGMRHDGPLADNECDPGSYIMSPTLGSGKITWSSCSRRYLEAFLETPQSRCLLDHSAPVPEFDHSREGRLPGERFDADEQCILKYGRGSYHAPQQPLDDVCRDLHCRRDRYTWTSHPALEGTYCGSGMWCRSGRCVTRGLSALQAGYVPNQRVDGSWSEWTPFSECASGCLYGSDGSLSSGSTGIMVSTRRCNKPRPENGGRQCQGHDRRFRACNAVQQCVSVPKTTVIRFADEVCERAREVDSELLGTGLQRASSDPQEACTVWCYKRNGGSKSRGWTFPDGTSCQLRSSRYGKSWYCINGKCEEFSCDKFGTATFSNAQERCPFERTRDSSLFAREWSAWAAGSLCRFNCVAPGRGLRLVQRECQTSNCIGSTSSIQLCEPEKADCPRLKTPFEHATAICSKYSERVRRLSGLGMQISPSLEDPDRPCRVACQDEKVTYRFYLVNGEDGWFPFGTDCGRGVTGKKAYCLSGRCMDFGDDDTPLHKNDYLLHPAHFLFKRSVLPNFTRITHSLDQEELDDIIDRLDLNGQRSGQNLSYPRFLIDWNNPIHIEEDDTDMEELNNVVSPSDFQFKPRKQKNHKLYDLNNMSSQGYLTATDEYSTSSRKCTRDGRYHMDNTECSNSALSAANDAAASSRVLCSHSLIMFLPLISHLLNLTQKLLKLTLS